jgi:hypothetical protein
MALLHSSRVLKSDFDAPARPTFRATDIRKAGLSTNFYATTLNKGGLDGPLHFKNAVVQAYHRSAHKTVHGKVLRLSFP